MELFESIYNAKTGEEKIRKFTEKEIKEFEAKEVEAKARFEEEAKILAQKEAARQSALEKLAALGLSAEEISAITGA